MMLDNREIGLRIKQVRESLGYTLKDVAEELGMNKSTVQRYESGAVEKIKLPVLEAMGKFLGVNPAWLIGKSDDKAIKLSHCNDAPYKAFGRIENNFTTDEIERINSYIDFVIYQRDHKKD